MSGTKELLDFHLDFSSASLAYFVLFFTIYIYFFFLFRAVPVTYGSSQATGKIGAAAVSLHHSHSNDRFKLHLQPMLQPVTMMDP